MELLASFQLHGKRFRIGKHSARAQSLATFASSTQLARNPIAQYLIAYRFLADKAFSMRAPLSALCILTSGLYTFTIRNLTGRHSPLPHLYIALRPSGCRLPARPVDEHLRLIHAVHDRIARLHI